MRHCYRDNFPPHGLRDRFQDQRECLAWWAWIPHHDNPHWLCGAKGTAAEPKWTVNPFTGEAYERAVRIDKNLVPFLKAPHRSFWRAIGTWDSHWDKSVASKHDGAWASDQERITCYEHEAFFTDEQAMNQVPAYTVGERGQRQPTAGGASSKTRRSRTASVRRPQRPHHER